MATDDPSVLIDVDNLSKRFCRSLRRSLWYGVQDLGGELLGRSSQRTQLRQDEFWSLKDVSFQVRAGESLGLIGHNGAGKSTLLKLLSGLIRPDAGQITIKGSMGALIELGAGFSPILTGLENIYVSAAIRGIPKEKVDRILDNIIEFAEIHDALHAPVQSYSSGMRVRLGFAVAAQLNPNILLVDEVLAVGDIAFRAKCRKRIQELLQGGTSLVLVSHNLHDLSYLCPKSIVLERGQIIFAGDTQAAIDAYRASLAKSKQEEEVFRAGSHEIEIVKLELLDQHDTPQPHFNLGDCVKFRIHYQAHQAIENPIFNLVIYGLDGSQVTGLRNDLAGISLGTLKGKGAVDVVIDNLTLLPNVYTLNAVVFDADGYTYLDRIDQIAQLRVVGGHQINGVVYLPQTWQLTTYP